MLRPPARPSVCPPVTRVDQSKTASPNSISSICCGFVVQQVVQQIEVVEFGLKGVVVLCRMFWLQVVCYLRNKRNG